MQYLLKQPLLHFLLIGAALFVIYEITAEKNPKEIDLKTVVVDKDALLTFMQYRSKTFDSKKFEDKLNNMSEEKLNTLIEDYVREEVLYREALGLGLDKDDYVIRRRLVQKVDFINEGFLRSSMNIDDSQIQEYFEENKEFYKVEPYVTFTHVFFSSELHGMEKARELALNELKLLNDKKVQFSESVKHGDRFLYHLNYVERVPDYVESHFGNQMAESLFGLDPSENSWTGPYESPYGFHLVMLTKNEKAKYPELEDVYYRVKQDVTYNSLLEEKEKSIDDIIDSYDVKIIYRNNNNIKKPGTASLNTGSE